LYHIICSLFMLLYINYSYMLYYVNYIGFVLLWYSFFFGFLSLNVFFICPLWAQNWFNKINLSIVYILMRLYFALHPIRNVTDHVAGNLYTNNPYRFHILSKCNTIIVSQQVRLLLLINKITDHHQQYTH
jgi:hypothetical protein